MSPTNFFARGQRLLLQKTRVGQHLCALAVRRGRIVSVGFNHYNKTHPHQKRCAGLAGQPERQYLHAEIAALLRAPKDIDALYVVRILKNGEFASANPCPVCKLAIKQFRNLKVYHT